MIESIVEACRSYRDDIIILCHGGPIAKPEDAQYIFDRIAGINGFYGASSIERLPTEQAITSQVESFNRLRLKQ